MTPLKRGKAMENEHPTLPLKIVNEQILGPDGVVGYVDYGRQYIYVCFFANKLIVTEYNTFDSIVARYVARIIKNKYYYAFKILCGGGATAVVSCLVDDVALVGVASGYLANGERIWTDAADIRTWPGMRIE